MMTVQAVCDKESAKVEMESKSVALCCDEVSKVFM